MRGLFWLLTPGGRGVNPKLALVVLVAALVLAGASEAFAGTVSRTAEGITYTGTGGHEDVDVATEAGLTVLRSVRGATTSQCTVVSPVEVACAPAPLLVVRVLGGDDDIDARELAGARLTVAAGAGADQLDGTALGDELAGEAGDDTLFAFAGDDRLDGGPGNDALHDDAGSDAVLGGDGDDRWIAGPGGDVFAGGPGSDTADYGARTTPLTITLDGLADDGEAGEGDAVGTDVEGVHGGSGADHVAGNEFDSRLRGGAGDDVIVAGPGEDRVEGDEGNDTIDTRDGRYDSVDCGPGTDVLLADPGDSAVNCEIAPDRDGDGVLDDADCAPDDPAVHPGAGEIPGNAIDEDCVGGPQYLRVLSSASFSVARRAKRSQARFTRLVVREVQAGDAVEIRCRGGRRKGCPFTRRALTVRPGTTTVNVGRRLKRRDLHRGATVEIRVTRPNQIGRVVRLTVGRRGVVTSTGLCLPIGARTPGPCTPQ
jgi:Ca2+-binding RTX toxin-like protein